MVGAWCGGFLSVPEQVWAADMMVMAHFRAAKAREITFRLVRASLASRISFLMINPAHFIFGLQVVPARRFISINNSAKRNARLDPRKRRAF
jgi:hypothetical protein